MDTPGNERTQFYRSVIDMAKRVRCASWCLSLIRPKHRFCFEEHECQ